jgi:hypothetical protein
LLPNGTADDAKKWFPGDELVAAPSWISNFSIAIRGEPADVWPWIVQLGYGRAGWYTWYPLDNNGVGSADIIVPALQRLAVGDVIPDGPRAAEGYSVWRVTTLERDRAMVLYSHRHPTTGYEIAGDDRVVPSLACSWAFVLREEAAGQTRLHIRVRARLHSDGNPLTVRLVRWFFGAGDTVMENTMLEGIRERVERHAKS